MTNKRNDISKIIGRQPKWHEWTDKGELVDAGVFCASDPIILIDSGNKEGVNHYCKCAGTNGDFVSQEQFLFGGMCAKCKHHSGPAPIWYPPTEMSGYNHDIMFPTTQYDSRPPATVPSGCPHAISNLIVREGQSPARTIVLKDRNSSGPILHSWKLVKTGSKLTLSLQYIVYYLNVIKGKIKTEMFYRHFTADFSNGQTYISNIHNDKHVYSTKHMINPVIDTLTYTGEAVNFLKIENNSKHGTQLRDLSHPLAVMYSTLIDILSAQGYHIEESEKSSTYQWRHSQQYYLSPRTYMEMESPDTIVFKIAQMNRFPGLSHYPLADRNVPLQMRRDFDNLPRDVTNDNLGEVLKIQSEPLRNALANNPAQGFAVVFLDSCGCDNEQALLYAVEHNFATICKNLSDSQKANHQLLDNTYDILAITLPTLLDERGWEYLIRRLCDNQNELSRIASIAISLSNIVHAMPITNSVKAFCDLSHVDYDNGSDEVSVTIEHAYDPYNDTLGKNATKYGAKITSSDSTFSTFISQYDVSFQKNKTKWKFKEDKKNSTYSDRAFSISSCDQSSSSFRHRGAIRLRCNYSLDRRKWNKPTAKKYAQAIIAFAQAKQKLFLADTSSEPVESEIKKDIEKAISKATKELSKFETKLCGAWKNDVSIISSYVDPFGNAVVSLEPEVLDAIYAWSEKYNMNFKINFEQLHVSGQPNLTNVRKNRKRRIKTKQNSRKK